MKTKVIDWLLMAVSTLAVLEFVVFPALDSENFLMIARLLDKGVNKIKQVSVEISK